MNDQKETDVRNFRASDEDLQAEYMQQVTQQHNPIQGQPDTSGGVAQQQHTPSCPFRRVPLRMGGNGRTHMPSEETRSIINKEVSLQDLTKMTNAFYQLAFQDATLDKFIRSHKDPHGERFAKWIHQKLTGSRIWDADCAQRRPDTTNSDVFVHDRSSAHAAAWYSSKRPPSEQGQRFTLQDCRVWMRLHFLAMRQTGVVEKSPTFADYYVRFIGHFVAIYERTAPIFCRESFRWSEDPRNVENYFQNGRRMSDVLSESLEQAWEKLPNEERVDY
eukprot:Nitzschia sp. Nitz4//scaffold301_size22573//3//824//NITZ4_008547-RA/size22573-processed-gene-0.22-mRNA-1//-1//CDS//3329546995//7940//frame0